MRRQTQIDQSCKLHVGGRSDLFIEHLSDRYDDVELERRNTWWKWNDGAMVWGYSCGAGK